MTLAFTLLGIIAAALAAVVAFGLWLDRPGPGGPDQAWLKEIGTETAAEEVHVRRLRISDLWRQRAARIGRRPRP